MKEALPPAKPTSSKHREAKTADADSPRNNLNDDSNNPQPFNAESDGGKGLSKTARRYLFQGLLLTFTASIIVVLLTIDETWWRHLADFPPRRAFLICGIVATAWFCNGLRSWITSRALGFPLKLKQAVGITLSMEFAIAATPGGVGGVATRLAYQKKAGIPLHISMTMLAADLSADLLFVLLLLPLALAKLLHFSGIPRLISNIPWEFLAVLGVVVAALIATVILMFRKDRWMHLVASHPKLERFRLAPRWIALKRKINHQAGQVWESSLHLAKRRPFHYLAAFLVACLQWTCRYSVLAIILYTFGIDVEFLPLVLLQGALFFLGLLVVAPGGGGSLELLSTLILKPLTGSQVAGLSVVLWRIFTYYLYIAAGGLAFLFLSTRGAKFWVRKQENHTSAPA